ncbi:hypothetical protein JD969_14105 [Planctomycetota bacterium]|nr:hypothetical protein JD969_14105 [Planctomycetota bacterium]
MSAKPLHLLLITLILCFFTSIASAQVGPRLLTDQWRGLHHYGETYDQPILIYGNQTTRNESIDLVYYPSQGKGRTNPQEVEPTWRAGYKFITVMSTNNFGLPSGLNDLAFQGAYKVGELTDNWHLEIGAGIGSANDGHWDNTEALYGLGDIIVKSQLDPKTILSVGIGYDGNRNLFPDIPLPIVQYHQLINDTFRYRLGLINGFTWTPNDAFELDADVGMLLSNQLLGINASATYSINKNIQFFAQFLNARSGFFLENQGTQRMFYFANYGLIGGTYVFNEKMDLSAGVGYAFDQRFAQGFDIRHLETFRELNSHFLFFFKLNGTF